MITVRISFKKMNEASYISLLDMQRVMQRVLKRSGLRYGIRWALIPTSI